MLYPVDGRILIGYFRCISNEASLNTSEYSSIYRRSFLGELAFLAVFESDIAPVNYVFKPVFKLIEILRGGILLYACMHNQLLFIFS